MLKRLYVKDLVNKFDEEIEIQGYVDNIRNLQWVQFLILRDKTGFIECGSRFKYVSDVIPMNYQALTQEIFKAIDIEAQEHDNKYVTNEKMQTVEEVTYDYDSLMSEFQDVVGKLMNTNTNNASKITTIVEKYLGKGKKVTETTPDQAGFIYLILEEIKSELLK